ncbi:hypothetical protein BDN71DRAFT_1514087 [Pleurotus eryngii]|uniref:Uncharacterized protein n=1 Tax=Pleurotus eryngii TaxID=5323 RepID=A0A9P5ZFI5_PLEER|nr:hypothetical protein BDN71DRAFT_1514087 [Pleurotus eryngii]
MHVAPFINIVGMGKALCIKTIQAVTDTKLQLETNKVKEIVCVTYESQKKEEEQLKAGHTEDDPTSESYTVGIKMISAHFNMFTAATASKAGHL